MIVIDLVAAPVGALALVDTSRYPIDTPDSPVLGAAIKRAQAGLERDGCARIPGFIRPVARAQLADETQSLWDKALKSVEEYTPYGSGPDDSFPKWHPRRRGHRTTSGSITCDLIPEATAIQQLYGSPHLKDFVATCLGVDEIHQFADPMRGLIINTMAEGSVLNWHFDANEFIVSLMTRRAGEGGQFEYCPNIRAPGAENFGDVRDVLDGKRDLVKVLDLQVGDLQIFKGRYSLHRVMSVAKGFRDTVIFGFSREPGFIGSVESTRRVYGRVMQAHIDAENRRHSDGLAD